MTTPPGTTPRNTVPAAGAAGEGWASTSRRGRLAAAALAVVLAVLTFVVVNRTWRQAAPPPPPRPTSVEARLIASPPASAPTPPR